ncbi:Mitochondrial assembly of ribosomal large subunit protein 1 [Triplophysa tibetana]|uniref:Mitochondrial assembly of ribosomal large subunit protein 1 n=1 Tax=Triplophysa tibetana TaxID=1572043 RepID=A0A5A9N061_9TELE|nr:Mitochondrial assembly of ribosomal large subunit protein 1 [Triplophysa tibetana]
MIAARCFASYVRHMMTFRASRLQNKILTNTPTLRTHNYTTTENITTVRQASAEHLQTRNIHRSVEKFDVSMVVSVLRQENASDVCVIRVPAELKYTDHVIVVTGSSPRHLTAMAEFFIKVFKFLRRDDDAHVRLEGRDCDDWKCIDFGPLVIHLMLQECRETYELEKLWTLRSYDEQLARIPQDKLPTDFIYDMNTIQTSV